MQIDEMDWTPEEGEMEAALRKLAPAEPRLRCEEMLFAAGRSSAQRGATVWKAAAVVGFLTSAILLGAALYRPALQPSTIATVPLLPSVPGQSSGAVSPAQAMPERVRSARSDSPWSYGTLLQTVMAHGVDGLPAAPNGEAGELRTLRADGVSILVRETYRGEGGSL